MKRLLLLLLILLAGCENPKFSYVESELQGFPVPAHAKGNESQEKIDFSLSDTKLEEEVLADYLKEISKMGWKENEKARNKEEYVFEKGKNKVVLTIHEEGFSLEDISKQYITGASFVEMLGVDDKDITLSKLSFEITADNTGIKGIKKVTPLFNAKIIDKKFQPVILSTDIKDKKILIKGYVSFIPKDKNEKAIMETNMLLKEVKLETGKGDYYIKNPVSVNQEY